jgi:hypothetical protein
MDDLFFSKTCFKHHIRVLPDRVKRGYGVKYTFRLIKRHIELMNRKSTNNKIPEMKDENGEVIDETLIPNAFNKYFVELGGNLANKIPR